MSTTTTDLQAVIDDPDAFTWGPMIAVHEIGRHHVVEYGARRDGVLTGETRFHPYTDGRSWSHGYRDLESALVGAIAMTHDGINTQADKFFVRAIRLDADR